jgi:hypothetical protein
VAGAIGIDLDLEIALVAGEDGRRVIAILTSRNYGDFGSIYLGA